MNSPLISESYTWDPRPYYPLVSTVKRYTKPSWQNGLTLVFTHGTCFSKEHWEPTIDDLLNIIEQQSSKIKIREIWSIEAPNHGDSAVLNEEKLQWGYEPVFQWGEYGRSIHSFLTGRGRTLLGSTLEGKVINTFDFTSHTLVGIGHSVGAAALLLGLDYAPSIENLFSSMIFVEPMIMDPSVIHKSFVGRIARGTDVRRDKWTSREDAYKTLKTRKTWKMWDDRVLKIFVETGLRPLPTLDYPDIKEGVTLKCSQKQEVAVSRDYNAPSTVYRGFRCYASRVRIHIYYGTIHDYISKENIDDVVKNAIGGPQNLASFGYIEGVGHTAPQQSPRKVAEKIFQCLNIDARARSKL